MKLTVFALTLAIAAAAADTSQAEQQVTLKSGVALVGEATFDGDAIVVRIADAEQRVPLADVVSVAATGVGKNEQARRLLLAALEVRVLGGAPREALALLEEAARVAPEDPQIAFWYASTLVDAGSGNAARRVVEAHRAEIEKEFPGRIEKLSKRINARMIVELLPEELVVRLDALNAAAPLPDADQVAGFSAFRVVDQLGAPVARSAIQVQGNINDSRIEEFPGGYFLATFTRHRSVKDEPLSLQISEYGLQASTQSLRTGSGQRFPASEFIVHRYVDDDKQAFRGLVVDRDGNAIPGARVTLQFSSNNGQGGPEQSRTGVTGDNGRVEFRFFPGSYSFNASAEGFSPGGQQVELPADGQAPEARLVLHKAIAANIRIEWIGSALQPGAPGGGGDSVTGETTIVVNGARGGGAVNQDVAWLRPNQVQDRLTLQLNLMMYGGMPMAGAGPWIKKWTPDEKAGDKANVEQRMTAALKKFDAIDLKEMDDLGKEFKSLNVAGPGFGPGNMNSPTDFGEILVGRVFSRDMRTGRPVDMTFKAIVEPRKDEKSDP